MSKVTAFCFRLDMTPNGVTTSVWLAGCLRFLQKTAASKTAFVSCRQMTLRLRYTT